MTTTISFATRDCIILGCDSLATVTIPAVPISSLIDFFDPDKEWQWRTDGSGKPVLKGYSDIYGLAEDIPYNQVPSVTKIFSLSPAAAGALFSGIATINNKSMGNIIDEFLAAVEIKDYLKGNYSISGLAERLLAHFAQDYDAAFADRAVKPILEIVLSGYSKRHRQPEVFRLTFGMKHESKKEVERGSYNITFGGQHDVIERVVRGIDFQGFLNHIEKLSRILASYREMVQSYLTSGGIAAELPPITAEDEKALGLLDLDWTCGLASDLHNFSDQAAIDFVDFLVDVMIKAQEFSGKLATVGGEIHIAIITKSSGFKWISKEEYRYRGYGVPKHVK